MFRFELSRFQYYLLTALVFCGLGWLSILTGFREYWGFWQSPEDYGYLEKSYPQWLRAFVWTYYGPLFWGTSTFTIAWLWIAAEQLKSGKTQFRSGLVGIIVVAVFFGGVLGMRCANNFIGLLDRGELHGLTTTRAHD